MFLLLSLLWASGPDPFCIGSTVGIGVVTSRVFCAGRDCRLSVSAGRSYSPGRIGIFEARLDSAWILRGRELVAEAARVPLPPVSLDAPRMWTVAAGATTSHTLDPRKHVYPEKIQRELGYWFTETKEKLRGSPVWSDSLAVEWTGPRTFRLRTISPEASKLWVGDFAVIRFTVGVDRPGRTSHHRGTVDSSWEDRDTCPERLASGRSCEIALDRDATSASAWIKTIPKAELGMGNCLDASFELSTERAVRGR